MSKARHQVKVYVCLLLEKNNKILLSKRTNTGWMDGFWHIPGGGLESNESLLHAVVREGYEELAVIVDPKDLILISVRHLTNEAIGFYFIAHVWKNEPKNNEPDLCSEIGWFDIDHLPKELSPCSGKAINNYKNGLNYSLFE